MTELRSKFIWSPSDLSVCKVADVSNTKAINQYLLDVLDQGIADFTYQAFEPVTDDKWLAVSSLHKSIRRGEVELAFKATATLLQLDPLLNINQTYCKLSLRPNCKPVVLMRRLNKQSKSPKNMRVMRQF